MAAPDETDGERIVRECASECNPYDAATWGHKIARRINAALAEQAARIEKDAEDNYEQLEDYRHKQLDALGLPTSEKFPGLAYDGSMARVENGVKALRAELAEREAQIAVLREELGFLLQLHGNTTAGTSCSCHRCTRAIRARDNTDAAARAFVERIQREAVNKLVEHAKGTCSYSIGVDAAGSPVECDRCYHIQCIIEALPALPPRRGT